MIKENFPNNPADAARDNFKKAKKKLASAVQGMPKIQGMPDRKDMIEVLFDEIAARKLERSRLPEPSGKDKKRFDELTLSIEDAKRQRNSLIVRGSILPGEAQD